MTKEKHPLLLAVAAVSLAAALAACDQAPAAGTPSAAPAPAAPAADEPGLRTETLIVAIVADEDDADRSIVDRNDSGRHSGGRTNATQTTTTADTTLSFPSDFGTPVRHTDEIFYIHYEYSATLQQAGITRRVIERGGITPWVSIDGGASWHTGGLNIGGVVTLRFQYRAGDAEDGPDAAGSVTIHLSANGLVLTCASPRTFAWAPWDRRGAWSTQTASRARCTL